MIEVELLAALPVHQAGFIAFQRDAEPMVLPLVPDFDGFCHSGLIIVDVVTLFNYSGGWGPVA